MTKRSALNAPDFKSAASTGFATLAPSVSRAFPDSLQDRKRERAGNVGTVWDDESRKSPKPYPPFVRAWIWLALIAFCAGGWVLAGVRLARLAGWL